MSRRKVFTLCVVAGLIFAFVATSSKIQAAASLQETLRELANNESYREAGGIPPTQELQREAGEWQAEANEMANEAERAFEELAAGDWPGHGSGVEGLREGSPLGNGGGGSCSYQDGWCPPSCFQCSPPAY